MSIESPSYEIVSASDGVELRRYAPYVRAHVSVKATEYNEATNKGFGALADYIFGNNRAAGSIAMTAPVTSERDTSARIAMTVPVTSERERAELMGEAAPLCTVRCPGVYVVSFTMPSQFTSVEDLPTPNNPDVTLEPVPSHLEVVVSFGGRLSDETFARHLVVAREWIAAQGLTETGEPVAAQFDAPWKPGFARHNEVQVPVRDVTEAQALLIERLGK